MPSQLLLKKEMEDNLLKLDPDIDLANVFGTLQDVLEQTHTKHVANEATDSVPSLFNFTLELWGAFVQMPD